MDKLANHTALKEWSTVVEALGRGTQVILLRKGGIADPRFGVEADRFYLYPTFYHQTQPSGEPAAVTISHWCEVVRTWRVMELEALHRLASQVAMPLEALETRYRFRPDQSLHVIGVRTFALPAARTIEVTSGYIGCRSWVSLDDEIDVEGSEPALAEDELQARFDRMDELLMARVV
jgi:hypothetical protein